MSPEELPMAEPTSAGSTGEGSVGAGADEGAVGAGDGPGSPAPDAQADPRTGLNVVHRRYVPYSHAHYAGDLVDGAYLLGLFGDVATEVCIRTDADEGLFASYRDVQFHAPVRAGDVVEVAAEVVRVGTRSRDLRLTASVVCRGRPDRSASSAEVLDPPLLAVSALGIVVVPAQH